MKGIILILFLIANVSFAQCLSKKLSMDKYCACAKNNTCLQFRTKALKNEVVVASKYMGKANAIKIYKLNMTGLKGIDRLFKGNFKINQAELDKVKKENKKLDKANERIRPLVEKSLKKLGVGTFNLDNRQKKIDKFVSKIMKKYKLDKIKLKAPQATIAANTNDEEELDEAALKDRKQLNTLKSLVSSPKNDSSIARDYKADNKGLDKVMGKRFKFGKLIPKSQNLFTQISGRYKRHYSDLIGNKIFYAIEVDKREIASDLDYLLKKLYDN